MVHSGGILNAVNRKYKLTQIRYTVSCTEIVDNHGPVTTELEMERLIAEHLEPCDACTARTRNGGLDGWAKKLLEVVTLEVALGEESEFDPARLAQITLKDCHDFMYALNVKGTVIGKIMEANAAIKLRDSFPDHVVVPAPENIDRDYAVDIIIGDSVGVQVKPESYRRVAEAHAENAKRNQEWGKPVHYLYYSRKTEAFSNLRDVVTAVAESLKVPDPHRPKKRSFAEQQASGARKKPRPPSEVPLRTGSPLPTQTEPEQARAELS
jgi:hypothetical protein